MRVWILGSRAERLVLDGANELRSQPPVPRWKLVLGQFESPLVWILVVAAVVSGVLGDIVDAVAITVIVLLNAVIGFAQEQRAEQAMSALRSMTAPRATVRRGGERRVIPAREVVVGDRLVLEAGDVVAADARVCEAHSFSLNEAVLTGESLPVDKQVQRADDSIPDALAERHGFRVHGHLGRGWQRRGRRRGDRHAHRDRTHRRATERRDGHDHAATKNAWPRSGECC